MFHVVIFFTHKKWHTYLSIHTHTTIACPGKQTNKQTSMEHKTLVHTGNKDDCVELSRATLRGFTWHKRVSTGCICVDMTVSTGTSRIVYMEEIIPHIKQLHHNVARGGTGYDPPYDYKRMIGHYRTVRLSNTFNNEVEFKLIQHSNRQIFFTNAYGLNAIVQEFRSEYSKTTHQSFHQSQHTNFNFLNQYSRRKGMSNKKKAEKTTVRPSGNNKDIASLPKVLHLQDGNAVRLLYELEKDGENTMQVTIVFIDPDISTRDNSHDIATGFTASSTMTSSKKRKTCNGVVYTALSNSAKKIEFMQSAMSNCIGNKSKHSFQTKMHLSHTSRHVQMQHGKRLPHMRVKTYRHIVSNEEEGMNTNMHPNSKKKTQVGCYPECMLLGMNPVLTSASDRGEGGIMCNETCREWTAPWDPYGETNFYDQEVIQLSTVRTWNPSIGSVAAFRFNVTVAGAAGDTGYVEFEPINPMWSIQFVRGKLSATIRKPLRDDMADIISPIIYQKVLGENSLSHVTLAWMLVKGPLNDTDYTSLDETETRVPIHVTATLSDGRVSLDDGTVRNNAVTTDGQCFVSPVVHNHVGYASSSYSWTFPPFPSCVGRWNTPITLKGDPMVLKPAELSTVPPMKRGSSIEVVVDTGGKRNTPEGAYIAGQVIHGIRGHHTLCHTSMNGTFVEGARTPWVVHGNVRVRGSSGIMWGPAFGDAMSARKIWAQERRRMFDQYVHLFTNHSNGTAAVGTIELSKTDKILYTSLVGMIDVHTMTICPGPTEDTPTTMVVDASLHHVHKNSSSNPLWQTNECVYKHTFVSNKNSIDGPVVEHGERDVREARVVSNTEYEVEYTEGGTRAVVPKSKVFCYDARGRRVPYVPMHTDNKEERAIVHVLSGNSDKIRGLRYISEKVVGIPRCIGSDSELYRSVEAAAPYGFVRGTTSVQIDGQRHDLYLRDPMTFQLPQPYVVRWDDNMSGRFETDIPWSDTGVLHLVEKDKKTGVCKRGVVVSVPRNNRNWSTTNHDTFKSGGSRIMRKKKERNCRSTRI